MIIVEGPDGAGKTTLVKELAATFKLKEGERGTADRKLLYTVTKQDTYGALSLAVGAKDAPDFVVPSVPRIWDRLYYSELVYAGIVGRRVEFNPSDQSFIQRVIDAARFPVILCLPPLNVVRSNAFDEGREQMEGVRERITDIWHRYASLLKGGVLPEHTLVYDYTGYNRAVVSTCLERVHDEVADYLTERKNRSWT